MLGKADATPMIPVKDLDRARSFYEDTLGLKTKDEMGGELLRMESGDTEVNVYRSAFAGTNKATALTFEVDDAEKEVADLKEKGVFFEHYDLPGLTARGGLYVAEGIKTAWFKDPDGNILSLVEVDLGEPSPIAAKAHSHSPALDPLTFLIGEWRTTGKHPEVPNKTLCARTSFAWHGGGAEIDKRQLMYTRAYTFVPVLACDV